jgi:ribosome-associated protein
VRVAHRRAARRVVSSPDCASLGSRGWARIGAPGPAAPGHPRGDSPIEPKVLAALAARLAEEKKGVDIRVYDVSEHIKVADYFVLASGLSRPHVKAIQDEIHVRLKSLGERHARAEGAELGWWVLLDYSDVVVHVLQPEAREYYALEQLYGDCPELDWRHVTLPAVAATATAG